MNGSNNEREINFNPKNHDLLSMIIQISNFFQVLDILSSSGTSIHAGQNFNKS